MDTIAYDEMRLVLHADAPGRTTVEAIDPAGRRLRAPVDLPSRSTLEHQTVEFARALRPVAELPPDAATLGSELADALLPGAVGEAFDASRNDARSRNRGLRVTLSLTETPELLPLPWELIWRPTGFVAGQAVNPFVRHLGSGVPTLPPPVDRAVRILAVAASPSDLPPLDVAGERRRLDEATRAIREAGRLTLEWLDPPTPVRLHEALHEGAYHVLHVAAHGGSSPSGDAAVMLVGEEGRAAAVDCATLRTMLGGQATLRVVVLNACHRARVRLDDPSSGLATSIIEAGVPAVVAMQFAISDRAAIEFATVLYGRLIGEQASLDAAVADARLRVRVVSPAEFATPVLYVRDPDVRLFHWLVPALGAPVALEAVHAITDGADAADVGRRVARAARLGRRGRALLVGGAVATAAAVTTVALWPDPDPPDPSALAGAWEVGDWAFVDGSVQPPTEEFDELPTLVWTIAPTSQDCVDADCPLTLVVPSPAGGEQVAPLEVSGDAWRATIGATTWCERRSGRVDPASTGDLALTITVAGEELAVTADYDGEATPEGTGGCVPDGPVVTYRQNGTGRRVGG